MRKLKPKRGTFPCPAIRTASTFLAGRRDPFDGSEAQGRYAAKLASEAGVSIDGKDYVAGMADYPFDPKAWVDSPDDIKRHCDKHGTYSRGAVEYSGQTISDSPGLFEKEYHLADDIVEGEAQKVLDETGGDLTSKEKKNLHADIREQMTPTKV